MVTGGGQGALPELDQRLPYVDGLMVGIYVSMELARRIHGMDQADPLNGSVYWFTRPTVGWVGWMDTHNILWWLRP